MKPFFSIIIPVYNVAPYLRECLDSVLTQTFADWECLCVDDGSTDESGAILDEYAQKDPRFRVFHKVNGGVSSARNLALDNAKGEWVWFVDGDDVIVCKALACYQRLIKEHASVDVVYSKRLLKFEDGVCEVKESSCDFNATDVGSSGKTLIQILCIEGVTGHAVKRVFRRKMFDNVRFVKGIAMMEDLLHLVDMLNVSCNWLLTDMAVYRVRCRADSASRMQGQKWAIDALRVFNMEFKRINKYSISLKREEVELYWEKRKAFFEYCFKLAICGESASLAKECVELSFKLEENIGVVTIGVFNRMRRICVNCVWRGVFYRLIDIFERIFLRLKHFSRY